MSKLNMPSPPPGYIDVQRAAKIARAGNSTIRGYAKRQNPPFSVLHLPAPTPSGFKVVVGEESFIQWAATYKPDRKKQRQAKLMRTAKSNNKQAAPAGPVYPLYMTEAGGGSKQTPVGAESLPKEASDALLEIGAQLDVLAGTADRIRALVDQVRAEAQLDLMEQMIRMIGTERALLTAAATS